MKRSSLAIMVLGGVMVSGCQVYTQPYYAEGQGYAQPQPVQKPVDQEYVHPTVAANVQQNQPLIQSSPYLTTEVSGLKERVRRVERALIRMDRRVQLIERNELSRMSSGHMKGENTPTPQGMFQPMSYEQPQVLNNIEPAAGRLPVTQAAPQKAVGGYAVRTMPFQNSRYQAALQPVSMRSQASAPQDAGRITSSLQVAPKQVAYATTTQKTGLAAMPSLADKTNTQPQNDDISIWTIRYDEDKVWPDRKELKSSHPVVQALRSEEPVALFARGANPASREFRERVRAVSKYLSKVSNLENVPIASMPAKHLDEDTIEILATK